MLRAMKGNVIPLPKDAPKVGETYEHYKGDMYRVFALALHSNDDEWMVVYELLYSKPDAPLFTRPLREWREEILFENRKTPRFTLRVS